jgi:hypothetical protein
MANLEGNGDGLMVGNPDGMLLALLLLMALLDVFVLTMLLAMTVSLAHLFLLGIVLTVPDFFAFQLFLLDVLDLFFQLVFCLAVVARAAAGRMLTNLTVA